MVQLPRFVTAETPFSKLLAMLVVIALPIFGFFLGIRYQETIGLAQEFEEERSLLITPIPTLSPAEEQALEGDETASWKTYTNLIQHWSIKYPPNWISQEIIDKSIIFKPPETAHGEEPGIRIVRGAEMRIFYPTKFSGDISTLEPKIGAVPNSDVVIADVKRITVAGIDSVKTVGSGGGISVKIPKGKVYYWISFSSPEKVYKDIFDQILSTFKFTQ